MNSEFKKGLRTGLLVYGIGITLTVLTHMVFGWDNAHAPPTSFIIVLALLILGAIRLTKNTSNIYFGRDRERSKGEISVHLVIFGLFLLFVIWVSIMSG
jgi:hypothetical protein